MERRRRSVMVDLLMMGVDVKAPVLFTTSPLNARRALK
jgi:hypothetical protein